MTAGRARKQQPFLFGDLPTLADAAVYGNCAMLYEGDPKLLDRVSKALLPFMGRLEAARAWRFLRPHQRDLPAERSRCLHPGQQHGRRWPSSSSSWVL